MENIYVNNIYYQIKNKKFVKYKNTSVMIQSKFSRNFNDEYLMITINKRKLVKYIQKKINGKKYNNELINYFLSIVDHVHLTVWRNPFIEENTIYHVVSGTKQDYNLSKKFGVYKYWFSLIDDNKFLDTYEKNKTGRIKSVIQLNKNISLDEQNGTFYELYLLVQNVYVRCFKKLVNDINHL